MTDHYWAKFWKQHGADSKNSNVHGQVLRTQNKQPISKSNWQSTLDFVQSKLKLEGEHQLLDLCCGNGLFSMHFSDRCQRVLAVDVSSDLLEPLANMNNTSIKTLQCDMRDLQLKEEDFDRILLYAAIQYFDEQEAAQMFENIFSWLKPGGIFYLGDVPNREKIWSFHDSRQRKSDYFTSLKNNKPIIGTWFEPAWIFELGSHAGFSQVQILEQPDYMLYSKYRYDAVFIK